MFDSVDVRASLYDDDRVAVIAAECGVHPVHVVGALAYFWARAQRDGRMVRGDAVISGLTVAGLEAKVGVPGLVKACGRRTGPRIDWIRVARDGSLVMPRARERFEVTTKERATLYERARKARWRQKTEQISREIEGFASGTKRRYVRDKTSLSHPLAEQSRAEQSRQNIAVHIQAEQAAHDGSNGAAAGGSLAAPETPLPAGEESAQGSLPALPEPAQGQSGAIAGRLGDAELEQARRRGFLSAHGLGSPRAMLLRSGVEEPSLSELASEPKLTLAMIERAVRNAQTARAHRPAAYIVGALRKELGLTDAERPGVARSTA